MKKIEYIKRLKLYLLFSILIFASGFAEGYFLPQKYPKEAMAIIDNFKESFGPVVEAGGAQMFIFIFLKNTVALIFASALGVFGGIIPVLSVFSNGFMVGLVGFYAIEKTSWPVFISALAPHGIFELPAFFLSAATGMKLGNAGIREVYYFLKKKPRSGISFKEEFYLAARFFVTVLVPLLFIAALMETYITPKLISADIQL